MKRRHFLGQTAASLFLAGLVLTGPVSAATFAEGVIAQLTRQGFAAIASETTWLGRVRITAERNGGTREIVLNPRTGEILRDIWTPADDTAAQVPIVDDIGPASSGGSDDGGSSGGGDDGGGSDSGSGNGDSGSGSGSGGSGSGGSGSGSDGHDDGGGDHGGKGKG